MAALMDVLPKNIGDTPEGKMMGTIFGSPIDEAYYQANNPLHLARTVPLATLRSMKIYFDVGDHDHYGFNVGNAELGRILKRRKVAHEFHIYPGGHDMAFVLEHFAASLEWQAKALK
jgi:S-formylglutathione hydrolase FrmB